MTFNGESIYNRVNLRRMFPYDKPFSYISVLDSDDTEIGMIKELSDFPEDTFELLKSELERKYYICHLLSIISVKDRFGFSHWKCKTVDGTVTFTIRDVNNNIRQKPNGSVMLTDVDSNRYEIDSPEKLDKKSRKRIELYL